MSERSYRVSHVPQVPGKVFVVPSRDREDAYRIRDMLCEYDLFQYDERIKPDYCNASMVEVLIGGEWCDVEVEDDE